MEEGRREMKPPPMQPSENQQQNQPPPPAQKCPRCDSQNTKFCYYNNYSLSQPRYFCKTCRRYWTQGGTLRSVPVGGGCRKTKRMKTSSSDGSDSLRPQLPSHVGAAPYYSVGGFSSSLASMNSFTHPHLPFHVGGSSSSFSLLPGFNQQPQNHQPPEFNQMVNRGMVEPNRLLAILNQNLINSNGSNASPSVGTSLNPNFLPNFPNYGPPSS